MGKNVHTVHNKNGWQNKIENVAKPIGTFSSKIEAQSVGRKIAKQNSSEYIIHGLNGKIHMEKIHTLLEGKI